MSATLTPHEEQQFTILQLIASVEQHTETITRLESQSFSIRGFAELDANSGQNCASEDAPADPRECAVGGDQCVNLLIAPCMHVICAECANAWFVREGKSTCPMCRHNPISMNDLVQCPMAPVPTPNRQFDLDLLRCRLAEYRGLVLQVEGKLTSNVAPSFNTSFLAFLWQQVSELEQRINQAAVELGEITAHRDEDVDMDL